MNTAIDVYLRVREMEGRLYTDDVVRQLPTVPASHPLHHEWQVRAASCERLIGYLASYRQRPAVLELGCGNGWLAHRIAAATDAAVVGVDMNRVELAQAQRVFASPRDPAWVVTDITSAPFGRNLFDVIVLASSIQYFADLPRLFAALIVLLKKDGEIHILDSPFYSADAVPAARERSRKYYEALGVPEMASHYHHHSTASLAAHNPAWLYIPGQAIRGSRVVDSPFPWIRLRPEI
jgi:ubiquinone/menaquinone biosynthesis C-methylase UbiE